MRRKIAANYIFLPGFPLVKNGYAVCEDGHLTDVVDTGGQIKEIQGLEFYGGMIVPDFVSKYITRFYPGESLLVVLDGIYSEVAKGFYTPAIIEGVDLKELKWRDGGKIRAL